MNVIAFGSAKGSPGVTTTVCALAATWPADRPVMIVELDPAGGDLAARFDLSADRGLMSLAAAGRRGLAEVDVFDHLQRLPGGVPVFVGAPAPDQFSAVDSLWTSLKAALAHTGGDVLLDCGRLATAPSQLEPFLTAAVRVVVARPDLESIAHVRRRLGGTHRWPEDCRLLPIGERPYSPAEIQEAVGLEVAGVLADDAPAAQLLRGRSASPARLGRSLLMRSARSVAQVLAMDASGARRPGPARAERGVG